MLTTAQSDAISEAAANAALDRLAEWEAEGEAQWIVVFDERSDGGARLVGPFLSKAAGRAWLARQTFDYEAGVVRLGLPR